MTEAPELQPQYQADLAAVCFADKATFIDVRGYVDADAFTIPELKWLWQLGSSQLDSTGELPSAGVVAQEAASQFSDSEFGTLIEVHRDIAAGRGDSKKAILDVAIKFSQDAKFRHVCATHAKLVEKGRFHEARELMEKREWVLARPKNKRRIIRGYDDIELLMAEAKARRDDPLAFRYRTGIAELDKLMAGGPTEQDILTIVGFTGRGKTTVGLNLAAVRIADGHGGAILSSEMRPDLLMAKMFARDTRIGHNIIYEYGFTPEQERSFLEHMALQRDRLAKMLWVEQLGIGGMSRDTIRQSLDDAEQYLGANLRWVMVDDMGHCTIPAMFGRDTVAGHGANANWMAEELDERRLGGILTSQANRDGAEHTDLDNLAGHMELGRVSQWVLGVNEDRGATKPNPEDDIESVLSRPTRFDSITLSLLKARFGQRGDVRASTDLGCSFIGDADIDDEIEGYEMRMQ